MSKVKLKKHLTEYSARNKDGVDYPVYSVTNSSGFCTEYFTKDVSSSDKTNYKIVPFGYFAYNPSRINVGSIDCQEAEEIVIVSPLYNVFKCSESLDRHYLKYFFKSRYGNNLINANTSGSVRANLKFKTLCEFEISDRALKEQKEAVIIFESINKSIDNEKHILFLLDELIKSRFNEMFSTFAAIKPFEYCLCDDTKHGHKFDSKFYEEDGEIAIVDQGSELICGYIDKQDNKEPWSKECIIFGDHTEHFKYINFPIYLGADGTKLLSVSQKYDCRFVYYYLLIYYRKVGGYARHFKFLRETLFPEPPLLKQKEFASFVSQIDKLKFSCLAKNSRLFNHETGGICV